MSYCVNCGVELETSLTFCPLCSTPIINPQNLTAQQNAISPFPKEKGIVESVTKNDWAALMTSFFISAITACGILNLFVFKEHLWSIPIIGLFVLLWVFSIPFLIYTKFPMSASLLFDGVIIALYLFMLTFLTPDKRWFWEVGLPITVWSTLLIEVFWVLSKNLSTHFLSIALYFFLGIGLLCIGIETFLDCYFTSSISLSWSTIVLTVCAIICITLITIKSRKGLRNALEKRLHF